jgi:hypothetical protein
MKEARCRPTDEVRTALAEFYAGPLCVVTDSPLADVRADIHHLDDNTTNCSFPNLIPLIHHHNDYLGKVAQAARRDRDVGDLGILEPDQLMNRARSRFDLWRSGSAYGCARLAYWIATRYKCDNFEHTIRFACNAFYFCRHRQGLDSRYDLIRDVLQRDLIPAVEKAQSISADAALAILQDIAGIYAEHGHVVEAEALYGQMDRLLQQPTFIHHDRKRHAAILRKEATIAGTRDGLIADVKARLREATALAPSDPNVHANVVNTEAWLLIDAGRFRDAVELLEPLYLEYKDKLLARDGKTVLPAALTAGNAAELMLNYATALARARIGRLAERRRRALDIAVALFTFAGSRAYTLRRDVWTIIPEAASEIRAPTSLPLGIDAQLSELATTVCKRAGLLH